MNHQLYQQMILDHNKSPRGFCESPTGCCEDAYNPLCGDKVKICVQLKDNRLRDIRFNGEGCALSMASASILVDVAKGMDVVEFKALHSTFMNVFHGGSSDDLPAKLDVLSGVCKYPMRVKCVTMVWHAVMKTIERSKFPIEISDACLDYWQQLIKTQNGVGILLEFKQLGCYGWQFVPKIQTEVLKGQVTLDYGKIVLWLDEATIEKVEGTKVDVTDSMGLSQVVFHHPKAKQHCGCGESFVIESLDE